MSRRSYNRENPVLELALLALGGLALAGGAYFVFVHNRQAAQNLETGTPTNDVTSNLALPSGSYQESCAGCTYDGHTLSCSCANDAGAMSNPADTAIEVAAADAPFANISNINGKLVAGD